MKPVFAALIAAVVTFLATSIWWASQDDGKSEFSTNVIVVPDMYTEFDGYAVETTYTYREP